MPSALQRLGDLVLPVRQWNPRRASPDGSILYVDLGAVDQESKQVTGARRIRGAEAPTRARQIVSRGDVLVSTVRPNLNAVARLSQEFEGATASTGFCVLRPQPDRLDSDYLFHWVRESTFIDEMVRLATGASYPAVSDDTVFSSRLPVPPLPEQRRIADILDQADALRAMRREALAQLDELTQAIFLDMFGYPATNSKGWPEHRLDEVAECLDRHRRPVKESDRVSGPVPYYGANGQQGWIDRPLFDEPLVLVAEDGGHFDDPSRGVAYRIDGPAWVNNHAHVLRPRSEMVSTEFLHRLLRHYNFIPYISGTTRSKLTQAQLNAVKVFLPPLSLQNEFDARIATVRSVRSAAGSSSTRLESLFASLQHRAFRGEL